MNFILKLLFAVCLQCIFVNSVPIAGDNDKSTPEMIANEGYPVETHYVTTSDGYNLCIHRIPSGKNGESNGKVAYLQHGLLTSSSDWILFGPGKSLGYILADQGYDVWMGNARGNIYSRNHSSWNPDKDSDFWQFSWNEIGYYDLPTMIDYVLANTGASGVYYAGHSQGTTSFFVMTSLRPEYNDKIKVQASLAPIAYMNHMTSPLLKIVAEFEGTVEELLYLLGINEFLPGEGFLHLLTEEICSTSVGSVLCDNALFAICGFSVEEMDASRIPLIVGHAPAGSSTKQLLHYAQEIASGYFRQYDFGKKENNERYNQDTPPDYDLSKVTAPVHLYYSNNDWLAGLTDVDRLAEELGNCREKNLVGESTFNHLDFTYGINAPGYVYSKVVDTFANY